MPLAWVEYVVQGAIVAVAVITLVAWRRRGGAQRRDVALAMLPLVALVALLHMSQSWAETALLVVFVSVPLLYLRLARHLEPIGPWPLLFTLGAIAASLLVLLLVDGARRVALSMLMAAIIGPFLFTAIIMANSARHREGVARRRLAWTAVNASTFALLLLFVLAGLPLEAPGGRIIQVGLAFSYIWAFATPRPIREAWRAVAFRRFIEGSRRPAAGDATMAQRLEAMRRAASGVVEAEAAYVLEARGDGAVCVAEDTPFPRGGAFARRLVDAGHDGVGQVEDWTVVGLRATGQPERVLAVRLRSDRLFPGEDEQTLTELAQEIEGRFREAAYQEAQTAARQAAERLAVFRSDYLRAVAHEVANPLSPLKVELATLRARHGEASASSFERIGRSIRRLDALVRDIGAVARLGSANMPLDVVPVDLAAVVQGGASTYHAAAAEQGCTIDVAVDDALTVPGDPLRIQQIIDNLVSNAVKYSPRGGAIRIRLARDSRHAEITIRDEGLGMDEEQLQRLFTDYARVHTDAAPDIPGTGMGLYIALQLARLHGGDVEADSDGPGCGSRFVLRLPLHGPPDEAPGIEQPPLPGRVVAEPEPGHVAADAGPGGAVRDPEPGRAAADPEPSRVAADR